MKKVIVIVIVIVVMAAAVVFGKTVFRPKAVVNNAPTTQSAEKNNNTPMKIESSAFGHNQNIPIQYTCDGQDINPPLKFIDVPPGAQSLALVMDDPDAPMGTWVHWTLWNMQPDTAGIEEGSVPSSAVQGATSSGQNKYGGPCPPSGTHHYHFKLYALDAKLSIPSYSDKAALEKAMASHIISQAEIIGLYSRK